MAACASSAHAPDLTPTPTPRTTSAAPYDGQRWGGFLFADDPAAVSVTTTPPPVQSDESFEGYPISELPGYRQFDSIGALAAFLAAKATVFAPSLPLPDARLVDTYAVQLTNGRVAMIGIEYDFAHSDAPAGDTDLWIIHDFSMQSPLVYATGKPDGYPDSLGRDAGPPQIVEIMANQAVYLPFSNPASIDRSLLNRSALSWFDDDGSFWSIQGRNLSLPALKAIANLLVPVKAP
jgi:hypothetical protein